MTENTGADYTFKKKNYIHNILENTLMYYRMIMHNNLPDFD